MVRAAHVDHPAAEASTGRLSGTAPSIAAAAERRDTIAGLRSLALRGLAEMYDEARGLFVFRVRRTSSGRVREGHSHRYSAISLLGLAGEPRDVQQRILQGRSLRDAAQALLDAAPAIDNLGDLAVIAWAGHICGCETTPVWTRIAALCPDTRRHATVEVAWTLSALAADSSRRTEGLRDRIADRLCRAFARDAALFPHTLEDAGVATRHVSCFADFVYPTLALAQYAIATGDDRAATCAAISAKAMCARQGEDGQWWWHYDNRTGRMLERYPVYAVHQDSMAPMALFAAGDASATTFHRAIARGLDWLMRAPELDGQSLVDEPAGVIWRKVARREPGKLTRYLQAGLSRVSAELPASTLDALFPPTAIDFEDRPYHLGWVLYSWPASRAARWAAGDAF